MVSRHETYEHAHHYIYMLLILSRLINSQTFHSYLRSTPDHSCLILPTPVCATPASPPGVPSP
uniref:Uncharacterized protein n=2 Tax=Picea TaxID=3328 RepID=A0A101LVI2_PICGL|nr:hypothetical protein ABT39_MTgene1918 [Picea glauca]QHR89904.1 hypothetical protein Q903MT_gene3926 [Picea sitchensis]